MVVGIIRRRRITGICVKEIKKRTSCEYNGGVMYRRIVEEPFSNDSLPGYGPVVLMNRPMRTRLWGGVGAGGDPPPATRLGDGAFINHNISLRTYRMEQLIKLYNTGN